MRLWVVCACVLLPAGVAASAVQFGTTLSDAHWRADSSVFQCRLVHPIDQYGSAVFERRAGEGQIFYLYQSNHQFAPGEAQVVSLSPAWRPFTGQQPLGAVEVQRRDRALQLDWQRSQALVTELQEGQRLLFERVAWYDREQPVQVLVEPVGFRVAYREYQGCLAGLLPANYDQVARTVLYFGSAHEDMAEAELRKLDSLARYVLADDGVTGIYVDGHTDGVGLRADNLELSRERAEAVAQYLVERGVPSHLITTRWHGERYPVASNREASGRAQNRRVTLRVDRLDENDAPLASNTAP